MKPFFRIRLLKRSVVALMQLLGILFFILYIILPLVYRYTPAIQRHLVFLPFIRWPRGVNFSDPENEGMFGTRNFYLQPETGVNIGVWHSLPESLINDTLNEKSYDVALSKGYPIILYLHGNSGSRANPHRLELYKILQSLNYHVVTFDYRGYADSSQVLMSEDGVVMDAKAVYSYIKKHSKTSPVFVWGHSLGTGVATRTVSDLCQKNEGPDGMILESPFNNIRDEVRSHPLSYIFRLLPAFDWFFTDPLNWNNLAFESDRHIAYIDCSILILHAQDDAVIPIHLAKKLYHAALDSRSEKWPPVQFIEFDESRGFAHKYICRAPELPSIIQEFVDTFQSRKSRN